jgi:LPS-assembly lipoprotein
VQGGGVQGLSATEVSVPDTRAGYLLREAITDTFAIAGAPQYRLETDIEAQRLALGRRVDDTATRYELRHIVRYRLTPLAGGRVFEGEVSVSTTYADAEQPYAGVIAMQDAEARLASDAARRIHRDLARQLHASR